jgi:hypothetical protein
MGFDWMQYTPLTTLRLFQFCAVAGTLRGGRVLRGTPAFGYAGSRIKIA